MAFFASALTAAALAAAPATAQTTYDGLWNVTVVTKTGGCEPSTSSTLTVTDGKVSATGADVTGSIGREGLVRVSINGAYANGQLSGNAGSGKWNGASAGIPCSGRWEASRQ
jgi:type 1 fimbria pilin